MPENDKNEEDVLYPPSMLETASITQLLDEVEKRGVSYIFAYSAPADDDPDDAGVQYARYRWQGDLEAEALAHRLCRRIEQTADESTEDDPI